MNIMKDVAVRKTLAEMVEDRDAAVRHWADGYRLLDQACGFCKENARYGGPTLYDTPKPEQATRQIDACFWRAAFERTRMTELMDATAMAEFHKTLEREPPVFSMTNIEAQYVTMYQDADTMFRRGIYRVFAQLDYSYRTNENEPYQLSQRNIVGYLFDTWSVEYGGAPRLSHYKTDMINDIDRCVKILTGRKHQPRELETRINDAMSKQDGPPWIFEDDDYQLKAFKNGNGHLLFKDPAVVRRLNLEIEKYCNHAKLAAAA